MKDLVAGSGIGFGTGSMFRGGGWHSSSSGWSGHSFGGSSGSGGPQGALPVYGGTAALSKIFNPDIAVIGNFIGAVGRNEIEPRPAMQLD